MYYSCFADDVDHDDAHWHNNTHLQAGWVDLIIPDEICARSEIECQALRFRNEGKFDMIGSSEALCRDVCDTQVSGKCIGYTYSANDPWSRQGYGNPGYVLKTIATRTHCARNRLNVTSVLVIP